jgi:hypothetical protein
MDFLGLDLDVGFPRPYEFSSPHEFTNSFPKPLLIGSPHEFIPSTGCLMECLAMECLMECPPPSREWQPYMDFHQVIKPALLRVENEPYQPFRKPALILSENCISWAYLGNLQ